MTIEDETEMCSVAKNIVSVQCYSLRKTAVKKENKTESVGYKMEKICCQ